MKKIFLLLLAFFIVTNAFAQDQKLANQLVEEGIELHDKGDFNGAIKKYEEALEADKDNFIALAEKALTLSDQKKYIEAISICQKLMERDPDAKEMKMVYVIYGNSLDLLGRQKESLLIYDAAIQRFPEHYGLNYNKAVSLSGLRRYYEAGKEFEQSLLKNPRHGSSHNGLARIMIDSNKIASILAFSRFMVVEPTGTRATENFGYLQRLLLGNPKSKSNVIYFNPSMLDTNSLTENNFGTLELIMALSPALYNDKKLRKLPEPERFALCFTTLCNSLNETLESKEVKNGFFWSYYAPYFAEMQKQDLVKTFSYIAHAHKDNKTIDKWLKENNALVKKFYDWSNSYQWPDYKS